MPNTNGHGLKRAILYARVSNHYFLRQEFDEHGTKMCAFNAGRLSREEKA
jgi:hypothetical protein